MLREKLITTALVSCAIIGAAMLADYLITIVILRDSAGYTPLITLAIATILSFPVTYGLVSGRVDLRLAHDALADARAKAEADRSAAIEASRAKSEFLANMSHELRTPLNAILGFSEMLGSDTFADRRAEYAELIHTSGAYLLGLVNDLLDLSRIEANRLELHEEEIDLNALLLECVAFVDPHATQGGLTVTRNVAPCLPHVRGDRRALKQIALNLLTNAIKFSDTGKSVEIFARAEPAGGLSFGVKDNGRGIAEGEQAQMFERFGQSRHDICDALKGTGLGLPIVKGLAEAHGGRVTMQSRLHEGTCVTVWLPKDRMIAVAASAAA
jgi:signal transduction histidine kinase